MSEALLVLTGLAIGAVFVAVVALILRRSSDGAPISIVGSETIAEKVRAVGKLVGLEVHAKEIATSTKGWSWIPPILLSQAKVAMIFAFEKQYFVDLHRISPSNIEQVAPGRFRINMPAVEGTLRLCDVSPYDIQAGRILGLLDVIQMNAQTQKALIRAAQDQAAELFENNETRYLEEARTTIAHQLETLLSMFDVQVEIHWGDSPADQHVKTGDIVVEQNMERKLAGATT